MFEVDRDHWQSYWSEQGLPEAVNKTRTSDRKEKRKKPGKTKRAIQEQYKSNTRAELMTRVLFLEDQGSVLSFPLLLSKKVFDESE